MWPKPNYGKSSFDGLTGVRGRWCEPSRSWPRAGWATGRVELNCNGSRTTPSTPYCPAVYPVGKSLAQWKLERNCSADQKRWSSHKPSQYLNIITWVIYSGLIIQQKIHKKSTLPYVVVHVSQFQVSQSNGRNRLLESAQFDSVTISCAADRGHWLFFSLLFLFWNAKQF